MFFSGSGSGARVLPEVIKNRGNLLQKYLDHQAESELQALYALQALVHRLEHPQGKPIENQIHFEIWGSVFLVVH